MQERNLVEPTTEDHEPRVEELEVLVAVVQPDGVRARSSVYGAYEGVAVNEGGDDEVDGVTVEGDLPGVVEDHGFLGEVSGEKSTVRGAMVGLESWAASLMILGVLREDVVRKREE